MQKYLLKLILLFSFISTYNSQQNFDSLFNIWKNTSFSDSIRLRALNSIIWDKYMFLDPDSALHYSQLQYNFLLKNNLTNKIGDAINNRASAFYYKGFFKESLNDYHKCLEWSLKNNDLELINGSYINLSAIYNLLGNYDEALHYNQKSFQLIDKKKDSAQLAHNYFNSASIYTNTKKFNHAIEFYLKALSLSKEKNNTNLSCMILGHIGGVLIKQKKYSDALIYFQKKLELAQSINNSKYISSSYTSIGEVYKLLEDYELAIKYLYLSIDLNRNFHISIDNEANYNYLYQIYKALGDQLNALKMFELYTYIKDSINLNENFNESIRLEEKRKYNEIKYRDSIVNHQKMIYNTQRIKQKEKESNFLLLIILLFIIFSILLTSRLLVIRRQKKVIEKQRQTTIEKNKELERLSIVVSETENVILILDPMGNVQWVNDSFVRLNNLTLNQLIEQRGENITTISNNRNMAEILKKCSQSRKPFRYDALNITDQGLRVWESSTITPIFDQKGRLKNFIIIDTDITKQKDAEDLISQKNKDITDSINYAKRLQNAILPSLDYVNKLLPNSFIYFHPKSIVSGDFYWVESFDHKVFFAVADCTGHGVPGAMVSVICSNVLSKALLEEKITQPEKILNRARELVVERFAKSGDDIHDGMDISLCCYNEKSGLLEWSGANNPLWIIRNNNMLLEELVPDKQPIGMYSNKRLFTNHKIKLNKGDQIFLFSDGFADQFGGKSSKKYKSANFKKFLLSIFEKPMDQQKKLLSKEFDSWKGDLEQIDDVCVMGVRI